MEQRTTEILDVKVLIRVRPLGINLTFSSPLGLLKFQDFLRACSHEPGTTNYPGAMIAPGQALPRVHMMICCPGASSSKSDHYEFI